MQKLKTIEHKTMVCVIGAGIAGICAALAAARHGASVCLVHDRPVPGGASSSESRIHICGADRHNSIKNMRETGILEELRLENLRHNPCRSYSVWDTVLYSKIKAEKNITLFLNASCMSAKISGNKIRSVTAWQMTTQAFHKITAKIFIDCSGDGILAPLSGAEFRKGREAKTEFNESLAPDKASPETMGMSCLFSAVDTGKPQKFEPPAWAYKYEKEEDLPYGKDGHSWLEMGYWWIETGGSKDTIADAEEIRDELIKSVYGVWDHIKNHCVNKEKAKNWALDWVQFLPTKRESMRYFGEYMMTQNDLASGGKFEDTAAYGGWAMDDHNSGGINAPAYKKEATVFYPNPSPYGITYRSLYSKNIDNLMFAGRCASFTHMALSSARVMGTCAVMGQAAGTAAAISANSSMTPAEIGKKKIKELQQALIADDCYLPGIKQEFSALIKKAKLKASSGNPEKVIDGISRPVGEESHRWECKSGDSIELIFRESSAVEDLTVVFDSALDKNIAMSRHGNFNELQSPPPEMVKEFKVDAFDGKDWKEIFSCKDNYQRLFRLKIGKKLSGIRLTIISIWGSEFTSIYAFYVS